MKTPLRITPEVQIIGTDGRPTRDGFNVLQQLLDKAGEALTSTGASSGVYQYPVNGTIKLFINIPFGLTITTVTTICDSGTCTATFKINTTALGGTANSVSSTEQEQAHTTANVVAEGDDIAVTISANASCVNMSFTIAYTRTI